ncbi:hypothetical protein UFOVP916_38 [uncultured Caudovirales phage]|uniref:Uncharacterized protein n=1 Tax=uncultured Caudovirales phage TaxID=2100421 RepID=A0A6J5Q029_9CAUD|nr:hypothetical protein UFOVP827_59 [uncultured Caudovirales phage]CAB4171467.1 hypothetical protein UFOVP916_38 [uncultured Caudovirales phage]CAB4177469.1 hypothetical protein UFOVP1001_62 [uncultured Caudovirales phage]CAB4199043.1 hypothetical protein UFOVP1338_14 [uncultured Caudovirales phage]CAB4213337.1 hypothetical protein UFOVP1447_9 [uncultured Caudovirales phage]
MSFIITSKLLFPDNAFPAGSGVTFDNASTGDRMKCIVEGYFKWSAENAALTFDSATKTITVTSDFDTLSFLRNGFTKPDTFDVTGTGSNDSSYTIADISADGRTITTVEALTDEVAGDCNLFGTTLITAMDYLFNIIGNNEGEDYESRTDKGTLQRYTCDGLYANVSTPVSLLIGTKSFGWVPDVVTGDVSEGTVEGDGISDYKQFFVITTYFRQTTMWTNNLQNSFVSLNPPSELAGRNSLKHICNIEGKFNYYSPVVDHSGNSIDVIGASAWFNQNSINSRPEYELVSCEYWKDNTMVKSLPGLVANYDTYVKLIIGSRSGKFVDTSTKFILSHFLCPQDNTLLENTATTLLQNIRQDEAALIIGDTGISGINIGTAYQSLYNINCVWIDANNVEINFLVKYSPETIAYYKAKSKTDRQYAIIVSCQDVAITTTDLIDRVNVIGDFNNADYDTRNDQIIQPKDYIHCFPFPETVANELSNVQGLEGDFAYTETPFYFETNIVDSVSPTINSVSVQIVATKSGQKDFIIEQKDFNVAQNRKFKDVQSIDITGSRNFILPDDSVWNKVDLVRDDSFDTGTYAGYRLKYGFVLRYESWKQIVQSAMGGNIDIFKDVADVTQQWKKYSDNENTWELKFRVVFNCLGYDGNITTSYMETDIIVWDEDNAPNTPEFTVEVQYFDVDENEVPGIIKGEKTRILAKFSGDTTDFPTGTTAHWGSLFADNNVSGGIQSRRFATSEFNSETGNPFTTADLPTLPPAPFDPDIVVESDNLRMAIWSDVSGRVELDCFIESETDFNLIVPRLGFKA